MGRGEHLGPEAGSARCCLTLSWASFPAGTEGAWLQGPTVLALNCWVAGRGLVERAWNAGLGNQTDSLCRQEAAEAF